MAPELIDQQHLVPLSERDLHTMEAWCDCDPVSFARVRGSEVIGIEVRHTFLGAEDD